MRSSALEMEPVWRGRCHGDWYVWLQEDGSREHDWVSSVLRKIPLWVLAPFGGLHGA